MLHPLQSSGPSGGLPLWPGFWRMRYNAVSLQDNYKRSWPKERGGAEIVSVTTCTVRIKGEALFSMLQRDPFENRPSFSFPWVQLSQFWLNAGSPQASSQDFVLCSAPRLQQRSPSQNPDQQHSMTGIRI